MTVPFKFLPHEILNRPKPAPVIRIYPQGPHELFTPKPTEKPTTPPKLVTTICAHLWSQNPQATKKKKTPRKPIRHQASRPTSQLSTVVDPLAICCRPISHLLLTPSSPSTTIAKDLDHRRCQDPRQVAATPPQFEPPLSSPSSRCHSRRSLAPHVHCRTFFFFF